jgi:hypothetical protein
MKVRCFIVSTVGEAPNGRVEFSTFDMKREYFVSYAECISACSELHPYLKNITITGITELTQEDLDSFGKNQ